MNTSPVVGAEHAARDYYAVVWIASGKLDSKTFTDAEAARLLDEGTCYGRGLNRMAAVAAALKDAVKFRKDRRT